MSDTFKRRRRRTGSTSARYRASQLVPAGSGRSGRIGKTELAAAGAVMIVAVALAVLIWIVTIRAVQEQQNDILDRAEATLTAQASTMAETIGHELLLIDQSLTIIQSAWKADSEAVNLNKWQKEMPALTAVADDLFICDETHIIRQDILPQAVGQGVGSAYVAFPHGSLEQFERDGTKDRESLLLQGEATGAPMEARQFLVYIVRQLDHPKGWLLGASYRSSELTKLFAGAALGFNPVVALMDTQRGIVQSVVGPAARHPRTDISKTQLFGIMNRAPSGTWIGTTGIDDVERLHAFHRVANRDMVVLVAETMAEVMAPADSLANGAHALAFVATALVLAIGGLVLWELYTIRGTLRQRRIFDRNRKELERLRLEETSNLSKSQLNAARLQALLTSVADGIALFDSGFRLVQWNHPFSRGIGIEPRRDMPLDSLLRDQSRAGLFGPVADTEAEINRRAGLLRAGDIAGLPQPGPDGEVLTLRGLLIAEGGFILLLNGIANWEPAPLPAPPPETGEPAAPETPVAAPIEW